MKKILVTGGCGYIGSHTIVDLIENGFEVISVDNYLNSDSKVLRGIEQITGKKIKNYPYDLTDMKQTEKIFESHADIMGIIHFAALKSVGESVAKPHLYYKNNINSLLNVLECAQKYHVPNFIFSSSCSVYGNAKDLPVTEETELKEAESPYARTKQIGENIIRDFAVEAPNIDFVLLRYFNPAGAHDSAIIGEAPTAPPQTLVPIITETAIGKRAKMNVYGTDYPTRDGSCIRDYIHVMDLANAHTKALEYVLEDKNESHIEVFNLGIGAGVSVLEAISAFEQTTGEKLKYELGPRRPGDVVAIYANYEKAKSKLGWTPHKNIDDIMKTAWEWEKVRSA